MKLMDTPQIIETASPPIRELDLKMEVKKAQELTKKSLYKPLLNWSNSGTPLAAPKMTITSRI